jgi:hypothetical protein
MEDASMLCTFAGMLTAAVELSEQDTRISMLSTFGTFASAISESIDAAEQLRLDPDVPDLKACCCKDCLRNFFFTSTDAAKEIHGKLAKLKAEVAKKDATCSVPVPVKGKSKPRICEGCRLDEDGESSEEEGQEVRRPVSLPLIGF